MEPDKRELTGSGWCHHPDHGPDRHTLDGDCLHPESLGQRAVAEYQYRVDLRFWDIIEKMDT